MNVPSLANMRPKCAKLQVSRDLPTKAAPAEVPCLVSNVERMCSLTLLVAGSRTAAMPR